MRLFVTHNSLQSVKVEIVVTNPRRVIRGLVVLVCLAWPQRQVLENGLSRHAAWRINHR
jgi:hypothetical protein